MKNRSIDIFGTKWKIKFVDEIKVEDDAEVDGICNPFTRTISIAKDEASDMNITLFHEIIHAILHTGQYHDISQNEPLVEFLARGLNAMVKQGLLQWK